MERTCVTVRLQANALVRCRLGATLALHALLQYATVARESVNHRVFAGAGRGPARATPVSSATR
jgi:hypothetical protein